MTKEEKKFKQIIDRDPRVARLASIIEDRIQEGYLLYRYSDKSKIRIGKTLVVGSIAPFFDEHAFCGCLKGLVGLSPISTGEALMDIGFSPFDANAIEAGFEGWTVNEGSSIDPNSDLYIVGQQMYMRYADSTDLK